MSMTSRCFRLTLPGLFAAALGCSTARSRPEAPEPLVIQEQGSFAVGGAVVTAPGTFDPIAQGAYTPTPDPKGQTLHGDHAYVFYQVPVKPRPLPLVLWHGHGQSGKTWETTPDGREGFQSIFLRRRFPVYVIDQPRRGRAARGAAAVEVSATPDEGLWFGIFRLGVWPALYPGVQFSSDASALDQFFRQMVPNTGPYDPEVNTSAVAALFDRIGPGILVTHSQSGTLGWRTAIRSHKVRAIVSYEPGGDYLFPEGGAPAVAFSAGARAGQQFHGSRDRHFALQGQRWGSAGRRDGHVQSGCALELARPSPRSTVGGHIRARVGAGRGGARPTDQSRGRGVDRAGREALAWCLPGVAIHSRGYLRRAGRLGGALAGSRRRFTIWGVTLIRSMKRRAFLRLPAAAAASITLAGPRSWNVNAAGRKEASATKHAGGRKPLLVFFSRAGENYFHGGRKVLKVGNTQVVAGMIQGALGCDVFQIRPVDPYSDRYDPTVQRNVREQNENARPGIVGMPSSIAAYDTIVIGSPIWNVRVPRIMLTFAERYDFSGTTIYPFTTHAMSGLGTRSTSTTLRAEGPQ
jgi:flavodoxin